MKGWRSTLESVFGAFWYLIIVVLVPVVALMSFGLVYLWHEQALLPVLGTWLALTLAAYAIYAIRRWREGRKSAQHDELDDPLPDRLAARAYWSSTDHEIWEASCEAIDTALAEGPGWRTLQPMALQLLADVAQRYHPTRGNATWRFTLPEGLLILEETARRYRAIVDEHLPYADRITVASVLSVYNRQEQIVTGLTWLNRARRTIRLVNPIGAIIGEIRDNVTDRVLASVGNTMQVALQRLLLQEVVQVGIDLYSGRLKVSDERLSTYESQALRQADERQPNPVEPLQIAVIGQISAGKSTLINALLERTGVPTTPTAPGAEVDRLPTTDRITVYSLVLAGMPAHLLDTPGIESDPATLDLLLELVWQADLLVWVARATQPARAADRTLLKAIDQRFAARPARRRPPQLLVISHPDGLPGTRDDADRLRTLEASVRTQIGLQDDVEVVTAQLQPPDATAIADIVAELERATGTAAQTQLNRRRVELAAEPVAWSDRWRQLRSFGRALGTTIRKR